MGTRSRVDTSPVAQGCPRGLKLRVQYENHTRLRVHRAGLPWVVALMGSSLSAEQENALLAALDRVILPLDGDATGRAASRAIATRLSHRCPVCEVRVPDGTQPDQLSLSAIQQLLG